MNKVVLDETLRSTLNNFDVEVAVCDETGRTVGYFVPADWHNELLYAWAKAQVTDEELDHARQQSGGRTLPEIVGDLEQP